MVKFIDKILDKPITSTIAFILFDFIIISFFSGIFDGILRVIIPSLGNAGIDGIATIVVAIFFFLIYRWYMRDKLQNLISTKNLKLALILLIPTLILVIGNFISNYIEGNFVFNIIVIIAGFGPGILEEVVFRGFIISNLMRLRKNKNLSIYLIVALSAIPFGLIHIVNIVVGANVSYSILQSFFAICLGIILAAVYLRTGNLIGSIIIHSLIDIAGLANSDLFSTKIAGLISQAPSSFEYIFTISISIFLLILGLYYIRKEKWDDIDKVWEDIVIE